MIGLISRARLSQRISACLIIAGVIAGILSPSVGIVKADPAAPTQPGQSGFVDTLGHPDEPHINRLVAMGVVGGYGNGLFGPEDPVTREQFAKMLVLSAGIEVDAKTANLTLNDSADISDWARFSLIVARKASPTRGRSLPEKTSPMPAKRVSS